MNNMVGDTMNFERLQLKMMKIVSDIKYESVFRYKFICISVNKDNCKSKRNYNWLFN